MATGRQPQLISEDLDQRFTGEHGRMLADVSNAIVRLHKQFYGKGPTKARSHLVHDLLVVVLNGGYTRGEETLRSSGHEEQVIRTRLAMHDSVEDEFRAAVEQIVLRQALLSGGHVPQADDAARIDGRQRAAVWAEGGAVLVRVPAQQMTPAQGAAGGTVDGFAHGLVLSESGERFLVEL